jgi:hypothetical protein
MRSADEVGLVLSLAEQGFNNCEVARRTGVPRGTVRDWVRGSVPRSYDSRSRGCDRCGAFHRPTDELPARDYAYLLGLYLEDGMLSLHRRGVYRLRIVLDNRYPGIISECARTIASVLPDNRVHVQARTHADCSEVSSYSKALSCLFPQHGPGPKHQRPIELEPWQQSIVDEHPQALLRGLIHSDGCRHINRIRHPFETYRYTRYNFTNASEDIRRIFCEACDRVGVEWRRMNARNISVARRASVAKLDTFIGPKA